MRIHLFRLEAFKINIVRKGFCRIVRGGREGGRDSSNIMLIFGSFRPFLPSYHHMLGAYKSGSAELRAAITDLSLGNRLHGVYGPDNCRICILVILV